MSRPVRNERHEDRPAAWDPYFTASGSGPGSVPSYSVQSSIDDTGYTLSDPGADSTVPDRYGIDVEPVAGSQVLGGYAGAASTRDRLGMVAQGNPLANSAGLGPAVGGGSGLRPGDDFFGGVHANRGAPLEYGTGMGPEHSISDLDTGSLYDGGGWPEKQTGTFHGPLSAQRALTIRQELVGVDDYGDQRDPVDDLGRPNPGALRSPERS